MNNIDKANAKQAVLDHVVEGWACEKLPDGDREAFFAAVGNGRYIAAHGILTAHGLCWPWRRNQFDKWLASHSH